MTCTFKPGPFPWGEGQAHLHGMFDLVISSLSGGRLPAPSRPVETLSQPGDPFKLVVKKNIPAAVPAKLHQADPAGEPMARIQLQFKAPGMPQAAERLRHRGRAVVQARRRFYRVARSDAPRWSPSRTSIVPNWSRTFSSPHDCRPARRGSVSLSGQVRGRPGSLTCALEGQEGKSVPFPRAI